MDVDGQYEHTPIPFEQRYEWIDTLNARSFWLTESHQFDIRFSVHDTGGELGTPPEKGRLAARWILTGNTSAAKGMFGPTDMTPEARDENALANFHRFITDHGIPLNQVRILHPEYLDGETIPTLHALDIDQEPLPSDVSLPIRLEKAANFISSQNRKLVFAVKPGDCPIFTGLVSTPQGERLFMVHLPWKGVAAGYIPQTRQLLEDIDADLSTLRGYLSPGGHAENFHYDNWPFNPIATFPGTDELFVDVRPSQDGTKWDFDIDTPYYTYKKILSEFGIRPEQLFADTSDTSAHNSGYSSNTRSFQLQREWGEPVSNTRDTLLAWFTDPSL